MAENQDRTDDQQIDAFDQAQMAPLDSAYDHDQNLVDLDFAETQGIISKDLRKAIDDNLGSDYQRFFTRAMTKEQARIASTDETHEAEEINRMAYKNAFFAITRKFQFENRDKNLERADRPVMTALNKVVRFRIHDGDVSKRSSLEGMLARLGLRASLKPDNGIAILEKAFRGLKVEGTGSDMKITVHGVDSDFAYMARSAGKALDFFESDDKLPELQKAFKDLGSAEKGLASLKTIEKSLKQKNDDGDEIPLFDKNVPIALKIEILRDFATTQRSISRQNGNKKGGVARKTESEKQKASYDAGQATALGAKYKEILDTSTDFYKKLETLFEHLEVAKKVGVEIDGLDLDDLSKNLELLNPGRFDFTMASTTALNKFYSNSLEKALGGTPLAGLKGKLDMVKTDLGSCSKLTDADVSLKMMSAMVGEQNPELSPTQCDQRAWLISNKDVATIESRDDHNRLAEMAGSEVLQAASIGNIRAFIDFQYKVGGKLVKPFERLKPNDFLAADKTLDTNKLIGLFGSGALNSKTGFILLSALESFDGGKGSHQYEAVSKHLKKLIAEDLGVTKRSNITSIRQVIEDAFDDQLNATQPFTTEVFNWHSMNINDSDMARINSLNADFKALEEEVAREDIKDERIIAAKLKELLEEAKDCGVDGRVDFSADSLTSGFRNSKHFRSLEGFGHDLGDVSKRKAIGFGKGSAKGIATGSARGGAAFGLLGLNSAWRLGRMASGFTVRTLYSLFRSGMWDKAKSNASANWTGFRGGFSPFRGRIGKSFGSLWGHISGEVGKEKWKKTTHAERSDVTPAELRSLSQQYKKDAEFKPFEINEEPFVSMDPYKERIKQIDEMLKPKANAA